MLLDQWTECYLFKCSRSRRLCECSYSVNFHNSQQVGIFVDTVDVDTISSRVGKFKKPLEDAKKGLQAEACNPLISLLILWGG